MAEPMRLVSSEFTVCFTRPRRCERVTSTKCAACGWWEPVPTEDGKGTGSLFDPPVEHTQDECTRLQTDPAYRRAYLAQRAAEIEAGVPTR